ncbi:uncharacterized protein BXZ73DRAFT_39160 [Epithele typhae]|uniref:uncharacterized protein n=1 Tax=Epithele typhae TaxID=378194 RepID=UPI002008D49E|nr:uncharacterized protein BXZ73DRAFT_39160 [Epithele typhae]KAH9944551.1 hypothetical protein BXZ73DRAFT_39160 [Epithele typhae]
MAPGDLVKHRSGEDMDLLALVASLSLDDVADVQGGTKGKDSHNTLSDEELAFQLFAEEASALQTTTCDMVFARSLYQALSSDAELIEELERAEDVARGDRDIARALAEGRPPTRTNTPRPSMDDSNRLVVSTQPRISSTPVKYFRESFTVHVCIPRLIEAGRTETCVICRDDIRGPVIHAPCGDPYDIACFVDLCRAATIDESLFPPTCCRRPFDLTAVRQYLNRALATLLDKKAIEFGTANRVYCHRPACSAFLGAGTPFPTRIHCLSCWAETCTHCKAAAHDASQICSSATDEAVLALAGEAGWKRCPGCGHVVELTHGCNHMTCRCRYEFCYVCEARWKTCTCEQWDEQLLYNAAERRVERQQRLEGGAGAGRAPAVPAVALRPAFDFRQTVLREAARLRENHDCVHQWRYTPGAGNCEGCGHHLPLFLYACAWCHLAVCARCRRNRIL